MGIYSINESASAALKIAQAGILVTSQNVAGTSIEGFSRRSASTVMDALAPNSLMLNGSSFAVEGFTREYSSLIGAQLLNQQAKSSNSETLTQYVSTIDSVIANKSAGLSSAITDFFNTMGKYAADPTNKAMAAAITGSANVVAQRMTGITTLVSQLKSDSSTGLNDTVRQINTYLPALASVNQQIIEANSPGNSAPSSDLLDERDRILTNLQKLIGGQSLINSDGTATQLVSGLPLVERSLANSIGINGDGNSLSVSFKQSNGNITSTQTIQIVDGGQAGALLTLKNDFIPKLEQRLNTTAIALVKVTNETIVDNSTTPIALFGFKVGSNTFTKFDASNLTVAVPSFSINSEVDVKNLYDSLGTSARNESASISFKPLSAGQTLTIAGLTFTAGDSGANLAQVSSAFANISNGNTHIGLNASKKLSSVDGPGYTGGTFTSGPILGWSSDSAANGLVNFTSSTVSTNVSNLTASGTSSASVLFRDMVAGETLTIAGLTFTAGSSGAIDDQVSSAFANISDGDTDDDLNTSKNLSSVAGLGYTGGTFTSGTAVGWNSGSTANNSVNFTSSDVSENVSNLTASGTSSARVAFRSMAAGETLTIAGLTFTAGSSGADIAQVSSAFASISEGDTDDDLNTSKNLSSVAGPGYTGGTFTNGTAVDWISGSAADGSVNFITVDEKVSNLIARGSLSSNLPKITMKDFPSITMNDFPSITTWSEGYSGYSLFTANKLIADHFVSIAPADPLLYYNSGDVLSPKISSVNANTAQLKSSFFGNVVADLVTDVGVQVASWRNAKKADDVVLSNLKEQREQLSGVNLDEEAANLLRYQQLYSASTKILQTGNQMFNTLLAIMN